MPGQTQAATEDAIPKSIRRVVAAGLFGTVVEYYEFTIYGLLALLIAPNFFPNQNGTASLLAALLTFGTSYVVRPVGALIFGWFGDRFGRRSTLVVCVTMMGVASTLIGFLPNHAQIGVWAPVLLVLLRLVQGVSAGGELIGAVTYVMESVPRRRRGFLVAMNPFGSSMGAALGSVVVGTVALLASSGQMASWGWRIPFLVCLPLTLICLALRLRVEDSPEFQKTVARSKVARVPVATVFTKYPKQVLQAIGFGIALNGVVYVGLVYMPAYLIRTRGFQQSSIFWLSAACLVVQALAIPLLGALGDRFGRKPVLLAGTLGHLVLAFPILLLMGKSASIVAVGLGLLMFMLLSGVQATGLVVFSELFPARVRFTGGAVSYNISAVLVGGFSPWVATKLVAATGNPLSPAWWIVGVSAVGIVALLSLKETAGRRLEQRDLTSRVVAPAPAE